MLKSTSEVTRRPLPLILVRGFGGLGVDDEKRIAYQGFNDGTVYPHKRGENYIYEGLILRMMKCNWGYQDATNVVGYYSSPVMTRPVVPPELQQAGLDPGFFHGDKVVIDPAMALSLRRNVEDPCRTLWVFRYYDLDDRSFATYGKALVRLIEVIRRIAAHDDHGTPKVNIIAHSMGGLIVRHAVQRTLPSEGKEPDEYINKIVTLGTPHRGITFQIIRNWLPIGAEDELEHFSPKFQEDEKNSESYKRFGKHFPLERLLTVVGTNYRTYAVSPATWANRLFSAPGEFGPNYNRSDGLVKQISAQIPGAPRTFVHKCHGGYDSLVTARESFEAATRFFFGNLRARVRLVKARILRGKDWFGKSEMFFGVSIKPRRVDFDLFHQSPEAENCYGPFSKMDLSDTNVRFPWAGPNRLIWEGYLDTSSILNDPSITMKDLVFRVDIYVGERDLFGIGFSDNVVFRKQYYIQALLQPKPEMYLHTGEDFATAVFNPKDHEKMRKVPKGWEFDVKGTGLEGTFRIEIDEVPLDGKPRLWSG